MSGMLQFDSCGTGRGEMMKKVSNTEKLILIILIILVSSVAMADYFLKFDPPATGSEPDGYIIYFDESSKNPILTSDFAYHIDIGQQTTYPVSNLCLTPGVEYAFVVTAYNQAGESGISNHEVFTRAVFTPPDDVLPISINISGPVTISIGGEGL